MVDPIPMLRPARAIAGMAAVLLPYRDGRIDWVGFDGLLERTAAAGLTPAVNMDTGYVNLLTAAERVTVLERTRAVLGGGPFVAGAYVDGTDPGALDLDGYRMAAEGISSLGGTPVVFQSAGLTERADDEIVDAYRAIGASCGRFIAFELAPVFAPFGRIFPLDVYRELVGIDACIGAKHSSLDRVQEWERIVVRDELRPDFHVFTGNDLAIDMVMYGSDYLLGLAAFAPDLFAARDRDWLQGDPRFFARNDVLQAIGSFAFRAPVPAYKHSAAQFLQARGWIGSAEPHPAAATRPATDVEVLRALLGRVEEVLG